MNKIKTFEGACKLLKIDPKKLPGVSRLRGKNQKSLIATYKLHIIAEALNYDPETKKSWEPDWNNYDEYKYYPWFDLEVDPARNPSGFRFSDSYCDVTNAGVGSRLCYRTRAISDYAGTQFISLYKDMMVIPK